MEPQIVTELDNKPLAEPHSESVTEPPVQRAEPHPDTAPSRLTPRSLSPSASR